MQGTGQRRENSQVTAKKESGDGGENCRHAPVYMQAHVDPRYAKNEQTERPGIADHKRAPSRGRAMPEREQYKQRGQRDRPEIKRRKRQHTDATARKREQQLETKPGREQNGSRHFTQAALRLFL